MSNSRRQFQHFNRNQQNGYMNDRYRGGWGGRGGEGRGNMRRPDNNRNDNYRQQRRFPSNQVVNLDPLTSGDPAQSWTFGNRSWSIGRGKFMIGLGAIPYNPNTLHYLSVEDV